MTKPLDPRFAKVVELMRRSSHQGERDAARNRATVIALAAGLSLEEAIRQFDHKVTTPPPSDFMSGFADWMETKEPGYKAKESARRTDERNKRRQRAAEIITRYGSKEAALAPCWRERAIREALKPWIRFCTPPHERWTDSVDGYKPFPGKLSDDVRRAVEGAYPLPQTFKDARDELHYWSVRRDEIGDVLDDNYGDDCLDLSARLRYVHSGSNLRS